MKFWKHGKTGGFKLALTALCVAAAPFVGCAPDYDADAVNFEGQGLTEIPDLSEYRALKRVFIGGNDISDISALAALEHLHFVELSYTQVDDLTPLQGAATERHFGLFMEGVNPSVFPELPKLVQLFQGRANLVDIAHIKGCKNLITLDLKYNQIQDISPIGALYNLKVLELEDNQVQDTRPLKELKLLNYLNLENNQIQDVRPLAQLEKLETVKLEGNPIRPEYCPTSEDTNKAVRDFCAEYRVTVGYEKYTFSDSTGIDR
jgi:Leucine-rich repeat (LRR) protein